MRTPIVSLLLVGVLAATAHAEERKGRYYPQGETLEIKPDAYGLGTSSDQYGRPLRDGKP